jgi:hypothetical protein
MVVIALTTAMVVVDRGDAHIMACRWWKASAMLDMNAHRVIRTVQCSYCFGFPA